MVTFNRILCLFIIAVIIGFTTPADATQRLKYTGIARSTGGAVLGSATVTIYLAGTTTPANVYEASTGGDSVTSVTSDSNGRWTFYADVADYAFTQEYKVVVTKDGYSTITLDNIFNLSLPTDAAGSLINDGAGAYSWGTPTLASTATALASNPSDCAANQFATTIAANGNLTCAALTDADVPNDITVTTLTLADDSTITPPAAASATTTTWACTSAGVCDWVLTTPGCFYVFDGTTSTMVCMSPSDIYELVQPYIFDADGDGTFEAGEEITDEQMICGNVQDARYTLKSCGAKVTDNSTASHAVYKDSDGHIENQDLTIDAHAASTTITLIPGICPIIHNASQADSNINNTLPAVGAGKCFVALATSAEADKYWRLTAAAANTVCLNRTCGKDYIQFPTPAVGDTFTCMSDGTNWYCYDRDSDAEAGDL